MDVSYQSLKNENYEVFSALSEKCVGLFEKHSCYVIVVSKQGDKKESIILHTERTGDEVPTKIQNLETLLDSTFKFVTIRRQVADKSTIDSYLEDARALLNNNSEINAKKEDSQPFIKFGEIVAEAVQRNASDIHYYVEPGSARFAFRIDGVFGYEQGMNVTEAREMMSAALNNGGVGLSGFEDDMKAYDLPIELIVDTSKDGVSSTAEVKLRLSRRGKKGTKGYKAVMRVNVKTGVFAELSSLAYPPEQESILSTVLDKPYGIFLATGPVGSGKSTTSTALLEKFPQELGGSTIDDPIEFDLKHSNIFQFQVDDDDENLSLVELLKACLRHDPDLLSVAEIRDEEVAKLVFSYSRVGTVMMSTLHTNEAIYSFPRLIDLGIPVNELATVGTFLGILNQRLLRNICHECKVPMELNHFGTVFNHDPEGCKSCQNGFSKGRVTVSELLVPTVKDVQFILDQKWEEWRDDLLLRNAMKTLAIRAFELSCEGKISWSEVVRKIPHSENVTDQLTKYKYA